MHVRPCPDTVCGCHAGQAMMAAAEAREASLRRVFKRYDVDNSGTIDAGELALLLVDLQFDDRVVDEEFAKADMDASRVLSFGRCALS